MSVPDQAPQFPIPLVELLARARQAVGNTVEEKVFSALKGHEDTAHWLQDMKPFAFKKGAAVKAVPAARSKWEVRARSAVVNAVFATAKNVRKTEISVPGRAGKVTLLPEEMLDPAVQYGLTQGEVDLAALGALTALRGTGYTLDAAEVQAQLDAAEAQRDWAHGEHELQGIDGDLKALGVFADTAADAAAQLEVLGNPDPDLLGQVLGLADTHAGNPVRDYGTFQATAWYAPDKPKGRSIQAKALPPKVKDALKGAVYITGSWDALQVPRAKKAEAFDRLVDLFEATLKRQPRTRVVAAHTDDLVGKAAIMAAKRLGMPTVAVQLAGWDFKPARMQAQFCERLPQGADVDSARAEQAVMLAELVAGAFVLGHQDDVLTHNLKRQGKKFVALDPTWVKHNGLY
ncbi:hypothetical protein [Deinococcus aluminii]|uniref:DUF2399 domain-containing protein n=1 Tax=Deinococcus aluminii TaxID=1656885 RepID=A0ABP9XF14_9DEIO